MSKYYETETPIEVDTGKNILRYFPQAGKLQVLMPYWTNDAGEQKQGKTVTLNIAAITNADGEIRTQARELFHSIYSVIKGENAL